MNKVSKLYKRAESLSEAFDENFLKLGDALRELRDVNPYEFKRCVKTSGLSSRKAHYLVAISTAFRGLNVSESRLKKIGWTKLSLLAGHINTANCAKLLKNAETHSAKALGAILKGEEPSANAHSMLLYFSPEAYKTVVDALVTHGAVMSPRGLLNREEALLNLIMASAKTPSKSNAIDSTVPMTKGGSEE